MPISVATSRSARGLGAPLRALVRASLAQEGRRAGEIAVVLADDGRLRDLNRRWRGIDRATDVLSFSYGAGGSAAAPVVHGDLVVSLDRVRDQARRFRVSEGRELARVVIHGALHLAGLDHRGAAERRRMRAREDRALRGGRAAVAALERAFGAAMPARRASGSARARRARGPAPARRASRVAPRRSAASGRAAGRGRR
jgi:probable rRNA maturation factor